MNKKDDNTGSGDKGGSSSKPKVTPTPVPSNDKKDVKKDDKKDTDKVIDADTLIDDNVVYYSQTDPRWNDIYYYTNSRTGKRKDVGSAGCGITAMAMVIASLTDDSVTPKTTVQFSKKNGTYSTTAGTSWDFFKKIGKEYDLTVTQTDDMDKVIAALNDENCMVITSMGPINQNTHGHFTAGGHFIVLTDYNVADGNGQFTVMDPNDNNGNWGNDGTIIRTDNPGIVLADANMVDNEHKEYFIIRKK